MAATNRTIANNGVFNTSELWPKLKLHADNDFNDNNANPMVIQA